VNSKRISVIQLLPELNEGGVERGVVELNREFVLRGIESHVISKGGRLVDQINTDGGYHHTLNICDKNPLILPLRIYQLRKLITLINPNIIHARSRYPAWITWFANRPLGIPFVTTVHGMNSINAYSRIMTKGDKVICVSEVVQKYIIDAYSVDQGKIFVIQRGADLKYFDPKVSSAEFTHSFQKRYRLNHAFVVASIGRITWLKDYETFIKAISRCRDQIPNIIGLIIGGARQDKTEYLESLKEIVHEEGAENCIHFVGNQTKVAEIYQLSDLVVNGSIKMGNVGRTVVEALAMNTPVLCTTFKDLDNVIEEGRNGYIIETRNVEDLVEKIIRVHRKPITETRSSIPATFTLETMVRETIQLYTSLLNDKSGFPKDNEP
tara:strand:+ start:389 stop:1528 length:1140 start_codon:yes stop_codon:yes gene_type:complete